MLAILPKYISNVNDNITTESLSINDLLEIIEFLTRSIIARKHKKLMEIESKQQIIERRKEIEQELKDMLKETKSDFSLQHIKNVIFQEEDNDDMMKVVAMFDRGGNASELSNILELASDAWNYFPHKILNGLSPAEKALEYQNKQI